MARSWLYLLSTALAFAGGSAGCSADRSHSVQRAPTTTTSSASASLVASAHVGAPLSTASRPQVSDAASTSTAIAALAPDFNGIDDLVARALANQQLPGCVVTVGNRERILFQREYGRRAVLPTAELMTLDTRFDLASLTKSVATSIAIMQLVEAGRVQLDARAVTYLPELGTGTGAYHKRNITVRQLLLHASGLPSVTPLSDYEQAHQDAIKTMLSAAPIDKPGARFVYSDVGFIALGEIVARTSGMDLASYTRTHIFEPLGMAHTSFGLPTDLRAFAAPTELGVQRDGQWIRGEVHDPRAYRLGGVAGNAGVFSTTDDLSRLARALLNGGVIDQQRVLSSRSVAVMTEPHFIGPTGDDVRALGWDMDSRYSHNGGELLSPRAYGHGGYTGTSLWIDPVQDLFVVFLSNRVHPHGAGNVIDLAGAIANYATTALTRTRADVHDDPGSPTHPVKVGIDALRADQFQGLRGTHVGLVTNESARASDGQSTLTHFKAARGLTLQAVFTPEHGLDANQEGRVADANAAKVPVFSLFGAQRKPTPEMLKDIDTLVFDLQDVGVRFYTYASTLVQVLEAARENNLHVVVLDRPNPLGGIAVEGPLQDEDVKTFVNYHRLPVRHGMTMGELAQLLNAERNIHASLEVVALQGWQRAASFEDTGLTWFAPSPNLRTVTQARLYPALGLLESTNLSVGRGTDMPFEVVAAPWLDATRLIDDLRAHGFGLTLVPMQVTPTAGPYRNERCQAVHITVDDRQHFQPVRVALAIAHHLAATHPQWNVSEMFRMVGHRRVMSALHATSDPAKLEALWQHDLLGFMQRRERFLIYP